MAKFAKRSVYLSPESTYAGARPADGTYVAMPASETLEVSGGATTLNSGRFTGRTGRAAGVAGPTNATGSFGFEVLGLATQAGDGVSPAAQDHLDLLMRGIAAGTPVERDGDAATISSTALSITDLTDAYDAGDLVALTDSGGNIRWAAVASDDTGGDYTLDYAPTVGGSAMVVTAALGIRSWVDDDGSDNSITYNGVFFLDTFVREVKGLRISGLTMEFTPGQFAKMVAQFQGDNYEIPAVTPSFTVGTNGDPATIASAAKKTGCVYLNGVLRESAAASVDFGIVVQPRESTCSESGRINNLQVDVVPRVTITTPFADDLDTLAASKGVQDLKVVSGLSGGSACLHLPAAQIVENPAATDTNGILDQTVTFECITAGAARRWQFARV